MFNRPYFIRLCTLALLQFTLTFLAAACGGANPTNETPEISGQPHSALPMPPVSGKSLSNLGWDLSDGHRGVFSDYKGKVLVLDFYATWCLPCRESIPYLIALQKQHGKDGLTIVGLNVGGPGDSERAPDFARELGIQYPLAVPDGELVSFLLSDTTDIPQTFVFDRQGLLTKRLIGFGAATSGEITQAIEDALRPRPTAN